MDELPSAAVVLSGASSFVVFTYGDADWQTAQFSFVSDIPAIAEPVAPTQEDVVAAERLALRQRIEATLRNLDSTALAQLHSSLS